MDFNFVSNDEIKNLLRRDFKELQVCFDNKAAKAVLVLSGSILEAVLVDYFSMSVEHSAELESIYKKDLATLIDLAFERKIIKQSTKDFSSAIRSYRNLIHPGREVRLKETFDFEVASVSFSALKIILNEIEVKSLANTGSTASELLNKILSEGISISLYKKVVAKFNRNELNKLYNSLVQCHLNEIHQIYNFLEYITSIEEQIDNTQFSKLSREFLAEIQSGSNDKAILYIPLVWHKIENICDKHDLGIVNQFVYEELLNKMDDIGQLHRMVKLKLPDLFLCQNRNLEDVERLLNIARGAIVYYKESSHHAYLDLWSSIAYWLTSESYETLCQELKPYDESDLNYLLDEFNDGDYLPF